MNWFVIANSLSEDLSQYSVRVLVGGIVAVTVVLALASGLHHRYHFTKERLRISKDASACLRADKKSRYCQVTPF